MYSKFAFEFNNKVRIRFEKLLGVLNTILKKLLNINADVENQANYGVSVKPFTLTSYYIKRLSYSKNGLYKGVKL
jgi:hypothetical protein